MCVLSFLRRCVWAMPVCEENKGQCSVSSSIVPHLIFLGQDRSSTLELTDWLVWLAKIPSAFSYLRWTALGLQVYAPALGFFFFLHWESSSGPRACPVSASQLGHLSIPMFVPVTQFSTDDITFYVEILYYVDSEFHVILYVCKYCGVFLPSVLLFRISCLCVL